MTDTNGDGVADLAVPNAAPGDPMTGGPSSYKPAFNAWGESTSRNNNKPREWAGAGPAARRAGLHVGRGF
jgi:hypothetical protein